MAGNGRRRRTGRYARRRSRRRLARGGGKAGVSGKVIAGVGLAAAAAAGVAAATGRTDDGGGPAPRDAARPSTAVPPTGTSGSVFPGEDPAPDDGPGQEPAVAGDEITARPAGKPFDQTNGLIDAEGESDGTALGDTASTADREARTEHEPGAIPPAGGSLGQH